MVASWNSIYLLDPQTGEIAHRWTWDDRRIQCVTVVGEDRLLAITTQGLGPDKSPGYSGEAELRGLMVDGSVVFESEYDGPIAALRFDPATELVFEARIDGLGIIDPRTGKRLHHIASNGGMFHPALPQVIDGVVYMLVQEMPGRVGSVVAIRHP